LASRPPRSAGGGGGGFVDTWNPAVKEASITLSGGNLTAARNAAAAPPVVAIVKSVNSRTGADPTNPKRYLEYNLTTTAAGQSGIGICNAALALSPDVIGIGNNGIELFSSPGGGITTGGVAVIAGPVLASGDRVGIAFNMLTQLFWARVNGAAWLGGGDPATAAGGVSFAAVAGPYFVAADFNNNNPQVCTVNFGATAFTDAIPAGFLSWNG
jgi:hypothetical protein